MGKIDSDLSSENDSNFSSKMKTFFSFVFVFGLFLVSGYAVGESLLWLLNLLLTADH